MVKVETRWLNQDYFSPISGNNLLTLDGIQRSKEVLFLHDGMSGEFIHINEDYERIFEAVQEEESDLDSIDQFVAALQGRPDVMVVILNQQVTGCGGLADLKTVIGLDVGLPGVMRSLPWVESIKSTAPTFARFGPPFHSEQTFR